MRDAPASFHNHVLGDAEALAREVAEWLCVLAEASRDKFAICLCGGSTPLPLYRLLARPPIASRFPWDRVHWFWGDERFVPHRDSGSNYRMAMDTFLSQSRVPPGNIHAVPTHNLSPVEAAAEYEATLMQYYGTQTLSAGHPLFDVTLLGIGEDGHTASLFPGQPSLEEGVRWAIAVAGPQSQPRITLTFPALDSSRDVAFIATGKAKRQILLRAQSGERAIPAARVRPVGRLHWFADRAAASG